ncbi:MAG TPA: GNAT family N-acetyltransferase [Acidimicrobiales bacterium]|nr:GNAT family N-acetyltransferase [Acidimicrobiales bacterium]
MSVVVQEASEVTSAVVEAFERLVPQLSRTSPPPDRAALDEMLAAPGTMVLLALDSDSGDIVGSLTLVVFRIPTGMRAWIEDVVVDEAARGRGVGEALNEAALDRARRLGARTVELTSRPSREAANALYRKLGFVQRETNVYRYELEG